MVSMSFFMLLSILIIITLNFISDKFLVSISFSSSFGELSCSFIWGLFLCLPIFAVSLCLFLCIRYVCKDSGTDFCRSLPVLVPGLPLWICQWSAACGFSLLGLFVCRKNQAAHQGWLFLLLRKYQLMLKSSQRSATICRLCIKLNLWEWLQLHSSASDLSSRVWTYCSPPD